MTVIVVTGVCASLPFARVVDVGVGAADAPVDGGVLVHLDVGIEEGKGPVGRARLVALREREMEGKKIIIDSVGISVLIIQGMCRIP